MWGFFFQIIFVILLIMFNDIRNNPTVEDVKKIFGNKENAIEFLTTIGNLPFKELKSTSPENIYNKILESWDYDVIKSVVRHLAKRNKYSFDEFTKNSNKYIFIKETIENEHLGNKDWAFNVIAYDKKLTSTIRKYDNFNEGLDKHILEIKKNYLIKSYIICRSFLYEYFIVKHNDNIIPTLSNNGELDFYFNGNRLDLKNASSVTDNFKIDHGEKWMRDALNNPQIVAKYLYENQNENRFGSNPRIFIVELENKIQSIEDIENECRNLNFGNPHKINFDYMINGEIKNYTTEALVVFV